MKYFTILLAMIAALGLAACNEDDKTSGDGKGEMSDTAKKGAGGGEMAKKDKAGSSSGHPNAGRYVDGP